MNNLVQYLPRVVFPFPSAGLWSSNLLQMLQLRRLPLTLYARAAVYFALLDWLVCWSASSAPQIPDLAQDIPRVAYFHFGQLGDG